MLAITTSLLVVAPSCAEAASPRVTIAFLPNGTTVEELATAIPGIAPGLMSAGLGQVPASQSYLDMGQGTRLARSLYPDELTPVYVTGNRVPGRLWRPVITRAQGAPAEIHPGLLSTLLAQAGVTISARPLAGSPGLLAVDRDGHVRRSGQCKPGTCPGVTVTSTGLDGLKVLASRIRPGSGDLLIAIERPPVTRDLLAVGILGDGFEEGNLTSDTTRMDGYVLSTDVLPTVLARYGIAVPDDVNGRAIVTSGGAADVAAVVQRQDRLGSISDRRWGVLAVNLLIWAGLVISATAIFRRRGAAVGLELLAITMALVPTLLLLGAALEPSDVVERLIVGIGAPALAGVLLFGLRRPFGGRAPYAAFALAAAATIGLTAVDMVFGSPLTSLSLLGPNPGLGVRFFGIGNELEATIGALLMLGAGAGVTAAGPADPRRALAITATVVTVIAVLVFAPGRLGADVGAAITFPAGAAGAVIAALGLGRRRALLVMGAPFMALIVLVAIDLISGGDSHLSRSVLGAGGLNDVGDVFQRRITLGARSFPKSIHSPFFIAALAAIVLAVLYRGRIVSWMDGRPAALAGVVGAASATVIGTLANDSAALLLMVGTGFIAAFCGLAWASGALANDRRDR